MIGRGSVSFVSRCVWFLFWSSLGGAIVQEALPVGRRARVIAICINHHPLAGLLSAGIDDHEPVTVPPKMIAPHTRQQPLAAGHPFHQRKTLSVQSQLARRPARGGHHPHLPPALAFAHEGDVFSIGRPSRLPVHRRMPRELPRRAAVNRR